MVEIRTLTGTRLDVYPKSTIEVNMGGISLLNLQDRTSTYTNSFNLPRTPTNEREFAFASQPTRNNRPSIDVIITKGLFQRQAVLKVIDCDKEYNCSISYDDVAALELISNLNFYTLPEENKIISTMLPTTNLDIINLYATWRTDGTIYFPFSYNRNPLNDSSFSISVLSMLVRITDLTGITFSGSGLSDVDFIKLHCFNKYANISDEQDGFTQRLATNLEMDFLSCRSILKTIFQIMLFDYELKDNNMVVTPLSEKLNGTPIQLEGFNLKNKNIVTDFGLKNWIFYKTNKTIDKFFCGDVILSTGKDVKDLLNIDSYIPEYFDTIYGGYNIISKDSGKNPIIMSKGDYLNGNGSAQYGTFTTTIANGYLAKPLTLTGFYSNILNPIFANPVILEASRYLDPLTADKIMTTRVILSVQLGGRYWVDTMAYDLTTGQSKLTLIKLP